MQAHLYFSYWGYIGMSKKQLSEEEQARRVKRQSMTLDYIYNECEKRGQKDWLLDRKDMSFFSIKKAYIETFEPELLTPQKAKKTMADLAAEAAARNNK